MLGTWRWNVAFGISGIALTALFSFGNNPPAVVMLRGLYAFAAFFLLAYIARVVLALILKPPTMSFSAEPLEEQVEIGQQLDLSTSDEGNDLNELLKAQLQGGSSDDSSANQARQVAEFRPLAPPQFVSTTNKQPEELAKAIRHLTGE